MKTIICSALVLLGTLTVAPTLQAARISEPGTTFYGRVVSRIGDREFPITTGELKWTLSVPAQNNREYTVTTTLQSLGDGLFSYKLTVPHQALAYDLTVSDNNLPLTVAGWRVRHLKVLVNGQEATLSAPATDDITAGQSARAATYRIDLVMKQSPVDSDGDGLPDWWEDQHGTDKWNPNDPPAPQPATGGQPTSKAPFTGHTFAEWRQHYFPDSTSSLEAFAQEDPDHDGVANLFEYAFGLDPHSATDNKVAKMPRSQRVGDRAGIVFQRLAEATDLNYQVELSQDLVQWSANPDALEDAALPAGTPNQTCVCVRSSAANDSPVFLRVRVGLKP